MSRSVGQSDINKAIEVLREIANTPEDQKPKQEELTLKELLLFLCGEKPINGRWFGEHYEGEPSFWWRTKLKRLINSEVTSVLDELEKQAFDDLLAVPLGKAVSVEAIQSIRERYDG